MRYKLLAAALVGATLMLANIAQAAEPKIGVIDVKQVLLQTNAGQAMQKSLQKMYRDKQKELAGRRDKLLALKSEIDAASKNKKASAAKRKKLIDQYQNSLGEYRQFQAASEQYLQAQQGQMIKPLETRFEKVLNEYAKDHHYDIILRKDSGALYASGAYDVTTELVEAMDKAEKEEKADTSKK